MCTPNGVEVVLRPGTDGIVLKPFYGKDFGGPFDAALPHVEKALRGPVFRAKLKGQLETALPGLAKNPDRLVRNRSIEVHRLLKLLERIGR
ncbi:MULTISPECIES: hypothetical protein [unclassified Frankia]|uniref:hypothetical protein n=2 Tax=unclassified Frankia TaxID=2632575 RepID=UPI002AD50414|nr:MULTISPECIES: hypothetical protein [unclassified Frankia]